MIFEDELKLGLLDGEDDFLNSLQDEVVVFDELVSQEAGDQVGLPHPLRTLNGGLLTTMM